MALVMGYGPEVCSADFYTPEFYTRVSKVHVIVEVLDNDAQLIGLGLESWDEASQSFVLVEDSLLAGSISASFSFVVTNQENAAWITPKLKASLGPRMRFRVVLLGTGLIALRITVHELNSRIEA